MPPRGFTCIDCGEWVDRYQPPGRKRVCLDCGIKRAAEHNRRMAAGNHDYVEQAKENGREVARQIEARSGPHYEKWKRNMQRALDYS